MAGISTVLGSNQTFTGTSDADTVTAQSNDTVIGFDGNDSLSFTGANDTINGNIGNDSIESTSFAATEDSIFGGQGDDFIYAYASSSLLSGDIGNDVLAVSGNFDTVSGGAGNDRFYEGKSNAFRGLTLLGGQGDDLIFTEASSSFVSGDIGNDAVVSGGAFDTVSGGLGNDSLGNYNYSEDGFAQGDTVNGNLGDDTIFGEDVSDSSLRGGQGNDSLEASDVFASKIYGDLGNDQIFLDDDGLNASIYGGNFVNGGQGNDSIVGTGAFDETIHGGQDDDVLVLGDPGYNSILFGDLGNDNLVANDVGFGNDISDQVAQDTLVGGDGEDRLFSIGDSNVTMIGDGTGSTSARADLFYVQGFGRPDSVGGSGHQSTVRDFVSGLDHLSFESVSGTNANFTATAAEVSDVTAAGTAAAAVKTSETLYVFVAGATDGYLFYDGDASLAGHAGTDTFNAEITLTGKNDISDVTFNDIVSVTQSGIPLLNS